MGRPPGEGFSPSRGWLVSGLYMALACALRLPTTSVPRVTGLNLELSPDPPLRGHVTHPLGDSWPTPEGSRDPPLRGLVTHPWGVT